MIFTKKKHLINRKTEKTICGTKNIGIFFLNLQTNPV